MGSQLSIFVSSFRNIYDKNRLVFAFFFVLVFMMLVDYVFFNYIPYHHLSMFDPVFTAKNKATLNFAQEIWLGLLALVLGTLIIVISIASQSTPKLIDLYIDDEISLVYVWFLTMGCIQSLVLQPYALTNEMTRQAAIFLNSYILLPVSYLLSIPYILYILRYTKTSNVIDNIFNSSLYFINKASNQAIHRIFKNQKVVASDQFRMFEALNQLDDLLEYVTFKEPKGDIIHKISLSVQYYVDKKSKIHPNFFKITDRIRSDISFKTMVKQFDEMEDSKTFYENKAFRLLGNAYIRLIEQGDFDLASLCAGEVSDCGKKAIEKKDDKLIEVVMVRFNTLLRFGIKHGLRNNELRNIYNSVFHYSEFISYLVFAKETEFIKTSCRYLKMYGNEIAKHAKRVGSFVFLVDVFTLELKKTLLTLHEQKAEKDLQNYVLDLFLQMDNTPDAKNEEVDPARVKNDGVRVLQVALALYYIRHKEMELCDKIIQDIVDDVELLGEGLLREAVNATCFRIKVSGDTFWEDTDRGNTNLYYSPEKEYLPSFTERFDTQLKEKINSQPEV